MKKYRIVYRLNNETHYKDIIAINNYEAQNEFMIQHRFAFIISIQLGYEKDTTRES